MKKVKNFAISVLTLLTLHSFCHASNQTHTFSQYPNRVFVETGSYLGEGIQNALKAGFREIHSIELSARYKKICSNRFINHPNITIHLGDSSKILYDVIKDIDEPITFWLDGHYSGYGTALGDSNTPILKELDQIKQHPIKTHTILIDDVRQFGTVYFDFIKKEQVIKKLYEINPHYKISYLNGYIKNDILVAEAPQE